MFLIWLYIFSGFRKMQKDEYAFRIRSLTLNIQNICITSRERHKSAPYLRLKNIQRTTIGNIWKNYFSQKKFLKFFFSKKSIFLESRTMPKNSKRGHSGSFNVFTNQKRKGLPFDRIRKFSKKRRIVPKKKPKGGPFGLTCCTFGSIKILWFSARIEPPLSGFRNLVEEDEQQNRWTNCKKWTIQSEIVGWKRKKNYPL